MVEDILAADLHGWTKIVSVRICVNLWLDVTGAGDTVISTMTIAIASGANLKEGAYLANYAAGIKCGKVGAVPVSREEMEGVLEGYGIS